MVVIVASRTVATGTMKFTRYSLIFSLYLVSLVSGFGFREEFNPMDKDYDKEIDAQTLKNFDFPKLDGYKPGMYGKACPEYKYHMREKDRCPNKGPYSRGGRCSATFCDIEITQGFTVPCKTMVNLTTTFYRRGLKCSYPQKECVSASPKEDKLGCECQTIWCNDPIKTVYENNEKLFEGKVKVKFPCGCDCRTIIDENTTYGK